MEREPKLQICKHICCICIKSLNKNNINKILVVYSLILLLYRDPGSIRIIFTDLDPYPHHWLKWGKGNHLISNQCWRSVCF